MAEGLGWNLARAARIRNALTEAGLTSKGPAPRGAGLVIEVGDELVVPELCIRPVTHPKVCPRIANEKAPTVGAVGACEAVGQCL